MTFNRKKQLSALEKIYNSNENEAVVFYSSIDSDLHEIVKEFLINKEFFYYNAVLASAEEQLRTFKNSINEQLNTSEILEESYSGVLKAILSAKCEKRVIVIDEFQHVIKYSTELIDEILKCVSNRWGNQPVMFLLLSTNRYFVEKQMVDRLENTAYELSGIIKLPDLTFVDLMQYFPKYSKTDLIITYGITGGMSKRIQSFDNKSSLKDNIINCILSEDGYLYNRGMNILPKELREHSVYNTILLNLASGHTKLNELHKLTGFSRAKISVYINNLIEHNLIEKIDSYDTEGRENTVKGIYEIKDGFLSFFYRFVYPNLSLLNVIDKEKFYKKYISPYLYEFGSKAFKKVCLEYVEILNRLDKLPLKINEYGTWIGKIGNIDIVGTDSSSNTLIGLCEFEKDIMTFEDFEWLKFCVQKAKLNADIYFLFSKKDFDERIKNYAVSSNNVVLIDTSML